MLKIISIGIFLAIALIVPSFFVGHLGGAKPYQMYVLSNGSARMILVAETHSNTKWEGDEIFNNFLVPAFGAADLTLIEAPNLYGYTQSDIEYFNKRCDWRAPGNGSLKQDTRVTRYSDDAKNAYSKFKTQLGVMSQKNGGLPDDPASISDVLAYHLSFQLTEEFLKAEISKKDSAFREKFAHLNIGLSHRLFEHYRGIVGKKGLSTAELTSSPDMMALHKVQSIERISDHWLAFCAASPEARSVVAHDFYEAFTNNMKWMSDLPVDWSKSFDELGDLYISLLQCVSARPKCEFENVYGRKNLREIGMSFPPSKEYHEIFLRNRNLIWRDHLLEMAKTNPKLLVVVGALHLPDLRINNEEEAGLLTLMSRSGYTVTPIASEADLRLHFIH